MKIQDIVEKIVDFFRNAPGGPELIEAPEVVEEIEEQDDPTMNESGGSINGLKIDFEDKARPVIAPDPDPDQRLIDYMREQSSGGANIPSDVRPMFIVSLRERALLYKLGAARQWARGERTLALDLWQAYLDLYPDDLQANHLFGLALLECGETQRADEAFFRASSLIPIALPPVLIPELDEAGDDTALWVQVNHEGREEAGGE